MQQAHGLSRKRSALRQVLHLLRGCLEPGSAFCAASDGGVSPAPGLHVAHLSPGALQCLLQRFAAAGERMRRCETASLLLLSYHLGAVCFIADPEVLAVWISSLQLNAVRSRLFISRQYTHTHTCMILALTYLHGPFRLQELCERPAAALAPPGAQPPALAPTPAAFAAAMRCELRGVDARLAEAARTGAGSAGGRASLLGLEASTRVCASPSSPM